MLVSVATLKDFGRAFRRHGRNTTFVQVGARLKLFFSHKLTFKSRLKIITYLVEDSLKKGKAE